MTETRCRGARSLAEIAPDMRAGLNAGRIERLPSSADDRHFGVREWAWMAVRPRTAANPERAIGHLATAGALNVTVWI